jgi:hypothetical protein
MANPMRHGLANLLPPLPAVVLGTAVATVSFFTTLQFSSAPAALTPSLAIDRTLKDDRLPIVPGAAARPTLPKAEPALPEGCVAKADGVRTIFAAEVPGRCVAAAPAGILTG